MSRNLTLQEKLTHLTGIFHQHFIKSASLGPQELVETPQQVIDHKCNSFWIAKLTGRETIYTRGSQQEAALASSKKQRKTQSHLVITLINPWLAVIVCYNNQICLNVCKIPQTEIAERLSKKKK